MQIDQISTVHEMLQRSAAENARLSAFTCLGQTLTYQQVAEYSEALAGWLQHASGLAPGDRVAVQMPNILQYPVLAWAVLRAGMVLVNVNPLYTAPELRKQLQHSGAKLLFVLANFADKAAEVIDATDVEQVVVTQLADLHSSPKRQILNFAVRYLKKMVPAYQLVNQCPFRKILKQGRVLVRQYGLTQFGDRDTLALLQYTGGTSGHIKAAMISHGNLLSNLQQVSERFGDSMPGREAIMVSPLPLYHIYAFAVGFINGMYQGQHVILIPNPKDMAAFVKAIKVFRINGMFAINTLYRVLCEDENFCQLDFSGLKISAAGGMALSTTISQRWLKLTGCPIIEGYGLSECSPLIACNINSDLRPGTVGKILPRTELVLLDSTGRQQENGEPGEICVKGPQVMQGYWQNTSLNEDEEAAFDEQGWFHTGDVGVLDDEGCLRIVDRLKDIIIISGFNVYPTELEDYVCSHPLVQDACAIGVGDQFSARIKLFVVSRHEQLTEEAILIWCRQGLASYKIPKHIEFRTQLPKSNIGKVLRRELLDEGKTMQQQVSCGTDAEQN